MAVNPLRLAGAALLVLAAAAPAGAKVNVHVERRKGGEVAVTVETYLSAAPETVWETITDFEHMAQFVPSLRSSRVVSAPGDPVLVAQEGVASYLWYRFPVRVTFQVESEPPRTLRFRSLEGNLRDMSGEYTVEPRGRLVRLGYRASFRPDFWLPPHIGPAVMEREYGRQFRAIVTEISRRESHADTLLTREPGSPP